LYATGYFGAVLILSGLLAALIMAPVFDRVLKRHLSITAKVLVPVIGVSFLRDYLFVVVGAYSSGAQVCYLGLIFAVKPNDEGAIYALSVLVSLLLRRSRPRP
jgi:FLVCR family MFS transporter 7